MEYCHTNTHSPKQRAVAVDEVVSVCVPDSGEVSSEHGSQHGVWVALQRGQRRAVHTAAHVQSHWLPHLDRAGTAVRDNTEKKKPLNKEVNLASALTDISRSADHT